MQLIEAGGDLEHGDLHDVRGRTLDRGVERRPFGHVPQLPAVAVQGRQVPTAAHDGLRVSIGPGLIDDVVEVVLDCAEPFEVLLHQALGLVHADRQLTREPVGGESVDESVGHGLDLRAHLGVDFVDADAEDLRTDIGVQVLTVLERLDECGVPGQVRHDAHLDLGVVGSEQAAAVELGVGDEDLPDASTGFGAHGNVLQVRVE